MQGKILLITTPKEQGWVPCKSTEYENRLQTAINQEHLRVEESFGVDMSMRSSTGLNLNRRKFRLPIEKMMSSAFKCDLTTPGEHCV